MIKKKIWIKTVFANTNETAIRQIDQNISTILSLNFQSP